jgi:hypothetical protein
VSVEKGTAFSLSVKQSRAGLKDKLAFYLGQIEKVKDFLLKKTAYLVADSFYAKEAFVRGVQGMGLHLISKLRSDANLLWLYEGEQQKRGRKKK